MVAPNGARLGKSDHAAIPLTLEEIVETAGAAAIRPALTVCTCICAIPEGNHVLDSGLYREALTELNAQRRPG